MRGLICRAESVLAGLWREESRKKFWLTNGIGRI